MAAGGTSTNVKLGPGRLYVAALGTSDPTSCSAALPSADWKPVGYTENGTEFSFETTTEGVMVAEELDPILYVGTARNVSLTVEMAERTGQNLNLALGMGLVTGANPIDPPADGTMTAVKLVWDSDESPSATNVRYLFRQCTPSGSVTTANRKAPAKRTLNITFQCAKPAGAGSFRAFQNSSGIV